MNELDDREQLGTSAAADFLKVTRHAIHWYVRTEKLFPSPGIVSARGEFFFRKSELRRFDEVRRKIRRQHWDIWNLGKPKMLGITQARSARHGGDRTAIR